jgi:predicted nucleic acid-binding protein
MSYLLDTGILLRVIDRKDERHAVVSKSVRALISQGETLFAATQNAAEFCNVASRPVANNGLGLSPGDALRILEHEIEPLCTVLSEIDAAYPHLKRLIAAYGVGGKQVHDARLVAMMLAWQVDSVLTLNDRDFRRYEPEGIQVVTPAAIAAESH